MPDRAALIQPFLDEAASGVDLVSWVLAYVRREAMFTSGDRVLVAVSGGPDSVALLSLLNRVKTELGLELGVGHFDHGLRGRESREDARFVRDLAGKLTLPFHPGQGEVKELARAGKISLQMAARKLRLNFLKKTCHAHHYHKLALGHTADDQVELFFLRLLRGAGPEGLKGMWPTTPEGLVRPLLMVGKNVILAWLRQESLPYRQDSSNLSRTYLRNRVRLDLLPELERLYNPRLRQAVLRTQALLQEDERLLAREVARLWNLVGRELAPGLVALDLPHFFTLDPGSQKRLLKAAVGKVLAEQDLTAAQVNGLLALAAGDKSGGLISLGAGRVARAGMELHFFRKLPDPPGEAAITLIPAVAQVKSPPGWRWDLISYPPHPEQLSWPPPPHTAWLDLDKVTFPLTVRYFRPGDRFWPKGAAGAKKLQDFLVDQKIPRWLRPHLPLVESAGHLLWVPGLRVAEPAKLTNSTDTLLEIKLSPGTPATRRLWEMLTYRPAAAG